MSEQQRERFRPRGIGANWLPCFVCGKGGPDHLQADMASFVSGRAGGLRVEAMFLDAGFNGFLDYRPSEPDWVQFKLGACEAHVGLLKWLAERVDEAGDKISPEILAELKAEAQ